MPKVGKMESKSPVIYLRRLAYGDKRLCRDGHGDLFAFLRPECFDGCECEPYIPAARVTAMIETLRKQIGILTKLPASQTELHCAIAHLEQLISDVEA